ncbi:helix-turn-helix domain-containing protein [Streptomyces sp. NPDC019396]|uniref:helix-turn-helix domain-containing protein n=1 Tax=Streptomyces sp. NPDC019396 TaxID=3154687 RepID=UPI0033FB32EB
MDATGGMDPERAYDVAQFVEMMKRLKEASGLTYRQLEERAERNGRVLPRSTIADVLRRRALPRPQILNAFVHACGAGEHADAWLKARTRLGLVDGSVAGSSEEAEAPEGTALVGDSPVRSSPVPDDGADDDGCGLSGAADGVRENPGLSATSSDPAPVPSRMWHRHRGVLVALLVSLAAVLLAGTVSWLVLPDDSAVTAPSPKEPSGGWYSIRPVRATGLCVTEGRAPFGGDSERPVAVQRPCGQSTPPHTRLDPVGGGRFFVKWAHPVHGWGCLTVLPGGLLEPWDDCRSSRTTQVFTFERVDSADTRASGTVRAKAYRIRSGDGQCMGIPGADPGAVTAAAVAEPCADSAGQLLLLVPEAEPPASALPSATG